MSPTAATSKPAAPTAGSNPVANKNKTAANNNATFNSSPVWSTVGTLIQLAFACFCIYLTPFGRTLVNNSIPSQLFDLLFTDNLKDYAAPVRGTSFVGPALLATINRPLLMLFDEKVRNFIFSKVIPKIPLSPTAVANARLYCLETRMWNYLAARLILAVAFVLSLAVLRASLAQKFKSAALPRIFTAFCLASSVPLLMASSLQSQTFSMILLNLALAAMFSGHFNRAVSLLTVNLVIFDIFNGSLLLCVAFLVSLFCLDNFRPFKAFASIILTLPVAITVSLAFDSLFYNKFIWPQGELLLSVNWSALRDTLITNLKQLIPLATATFNNPKSLLQSKLAVNLFISLLPAFLIYIFGRANRYTRAMLSFYTINSSFNLIFMSGNLNSACTPFIVPLLVASSISVLGGIKSQSRFIKFFTYLLFLGILLPGIAWTVGRLHLEIVESQQFTGNALMALNAKIVKDAKEGVPVRVHIDPEFTSYGHNRFIQLSRNTVLYSTAAKPAHRTDYFIGTPAQCPETKAMKLFSGFQKIDLKSLKTSQTDRIGVFRASPTCPSTDLVIPQVTLESSTETSITSQFLAKNLLKGQFSSLKDQRDFIAKHLGKFNHKKISNSIALIAYLYGNILEQI